MSKLNFDDDNQSVMAAARIVTQIITEASREHYASTKDIDHIFIVIEHVTHFDWENTNVIGASYDEKVCKRLIESAERDFKSFNGERAEYWTERVLITNN